MSYDYELVIFAQRLSAWLHRDQTDKNGKPYIEHPYRVYLSLMRDGAPVEWQVAGLLHDVTEDTAVTAGTLRQLNIPEESVYIVQLLDRHNSKEVYDLCAYWDEKNRHTDDPSDHLNGAQNESEFYYASIRDHPGALAVKLADIADNTLEWRLESLDEKTQDRLRAKYARALELLQPEER